MTQRDPIQTNRENGVIRKGWAGRRRVALVYPNTYAVGMSNLGFQAVYRLFNSIDSVVCERVFLPADGSPPGSLESARPLDAFDMVAFSISYENDFPNLLTLLDGAGIPLVAAGRGASAPLIIAGGVACTLNPEPVAPFVDLFFIGEAEPALHGLMGRFDPGEDRLQALWRMAREVPGVYVPRLYRPTYGAGGALEGFEPEPGAPVPVCRVRAPELSNISTCSAILTPDTTFEKTYLIEVSRGCPHGCRFCSAGFIYRPPRFRPLERLADDLARGEALTDRIGLVGAAVSDHPDLAALCGRVTRPGTVLSFSSLRADALTPELIAQLKASRVKTATIAPDAGSERLRRVINKGLTAEQILTAAERLVAGGIPNLKLYFMVGLPTETDEDVAAIVSLCKGVKHQFLASSRARGRIGGITVSLSPFVPKPVTPFQWAAMDDTGALKAKIKRVKDGLRRVANLRVHADIPRWAYVQALLSRGDRRVGDLLLRAHHNRGNWPQTFKASSLNPDFFVRRERDADERLPWDFIDSGVHKSFLYREYRRALDGQPSAPCPGGSCSSCGVCTPGP